jgi:hypothetical protein
MNERADSQTTKVTRKTLRLLRLISAMNEERQYQVLERLVQQEYARLQRETRERHP